MTRRELEITDLAEIRKNPVCCFEIECDVTPFEGKVACQYGTAYSSIIGRGEIEISSNPADKMHAMKTFMKSQTGRDFEFKDKMLTAVELMRINVSEFTAKKRPLPETRVGK